MHRIHTVETQPIQIAHVYSAPTHGYIRQSIRSTIFDQIVRSQKRRKNTYTQKVIVQNPNTPRLRAKYLTNTHKRKPKMTPRHRKISNSDPSQLNSGGKPSSMFPPGRFVSLCLRNYFNTKYELRPRGFLRQKKFPWNGISAREIYYRLDFH